MALRWLVHSVCASTFGYPKDLNTKYSQSIHYATNGESTKVVTNEGKACPTMFQMPLHYPRYKKADYEKMEEWKVDMLLKEYGLRYEGTLDEKRSFAIGCFLWPDHA